MEIKLGKMQRVVDLRSVWPHEEHDFSQWMARACSRANFLVFSSYFMVK